METLDSLWNFCTSNNRICPMPMLWNDLYLMLKDSKNVDLPLILNGWEMSSPLEKHLRFEEHIQWASKMNQLEEISQFLRSLSEDQWLHYSE